MSKSASAELINNNTEIFRIYSRRLSNPADADIFITSARKLTSFLSNLRAYYAEAQQPIVDILEVTCNSLKSIAPDVFSTAGFMDRSAIPEDKAPLFEAFVQLIDTVTPYVPHFTDKYQNSRLCLFLSSLGVVLPPGALGGTSADQTPTASSTWIQANFTPSQAISSDTSSSNIVDPRPTSPPPIPVASTNVTASSSAPSPTHVPSVAPTEKNASVTGTVVQSIANHQTVHFPPRDPRHQPPLARAPVPGEVPDHIPANPSTHDQIPLPPLLQTSSINTKPLSSLSPQMASPSPQETQPMPSMVSGVTQVQAPVQNPASAPRAAAAAASGQPKPKPPPRRQSSGLDFLQLDLKVAREKKLRAVTQASPVAVSSPVLPSKASPPAAATPTPGPTAAPACQPSKAQAPSSNLAYRDLRQGSTRNGSSATPRKLRITSRAPAPAPTPEPGSEGAPIVIDEEEAPITAPAEVQAKTEEMTTPVLDSLDVRGSKAEPEGQAKSEQLPQESASVVDLPPQPPVSGFEPSVTGALQVSAPSSTSSPLTSASTPSSAVPASRSPGPTTSSNDKPQEALSQQATEGKEIQGEKDGKDSMDTDAGITLAGAEHGMTMEGPVATESAATIEPNLGSESSAPSLGSTQLASAGVTAAPNNNETKLTPPPMTNSATESLLAPVTSTTSTAIPAKPGPRLVMDVRVHALPQAADECSSYSSLTELSPTPISGQQAPGIAMSEALPTPANGKPPTPSDGDTRKATAMGVSPNPIPEKQQDPPPQFSVVDSTPPPAIPLHSQPPRENDGSSATFLGSSFPRRTSANNQGPTSSGNASASTLSVPAIVSHNKVQSLNDMNISRTSPSPPPIAVLGTRTGGSSPANRSSESRSASPPLGRRPSASGVEEIEDDEMVDELAPLFGKEMKVLCMDRPYDVPGEFVWNFTLIDSDWDQVSLWIRAPENLDLDISQARCISLACYSIQDLIPYASQVCLAREQWFENAKPIPWEKLPRNLWLLINDKAAVVFPPYMAPDDLFDVSPFLRLGQNKMCFTQIDGMAEYVFVLHGHRPTRGQLGPLHACWAEDRHFQEQLAWFSRPFSIKW